MSKTTKNISQRNWIISSVLASAVSVVAYLLIDFLYAGDESRVQAYGRLSGVLAVVSLAALLVSIVAVYKLKGKIRLLPMGSIVILFLILCLSLFAVAFSGFAGSH